MSSVQLTDERTADSRPGDETAASSTTREAAADDDAQSNRRVRIDLSVGSLVVGSLAAITAAALGAQLGVAGTIIGAGVGSLVSAIATALFNASWQHGRSGLRTAYQRTARSRSGSALGLAPDEGNRSHRAASFLSRLRAVPRRWRLIVIGALAAFVLAFVSITAWETLTGQALSGERGGTTIGHLADGAGTTAVPDHEPATSTPQSDTSQESGTDAGSDAGTSGNAQPSEQDTTEAPQTDTPASPTTPTDGADSSTTEPQPSEPAQPSDNSDTPTGSGGTDTGGAGTGSTDTGSTDTGSTNTGDAAPPAGSADTGATS